MSVKLICDKCGAECEERYRIREKKKNATGYDANDFLTFIIENEIGQYNLCKKCIIEGLNNIPEYYTGVIR